MSIDLNANYFQLFDLPQGFELDLAELKSRQRRLQLELHPDRHAGDERAQRLAVQYTAQLNQAFETLKSPLLRAEYLLQLAGVDTNYDSRSHSDPEFLMAQMEQREALEALKAEAQQDADAAERGLQQLQRAQREQALALYATFSQQFEAGDYSGAEALLARAHFIEKFGRQLRELEDYLLDL
ncbi:MAG: Fe-S protein assembly co-chaperone HscB [Cellvibrionaceae bacterium]|nr:Fe-S protein assembly co-chaperone HscB [Cellvibrionaceae bacterium]